MSAWCARLTSVDFYARIFGSGKRYEVASNELPAAVQPHMWMKHVF